MRDKGRERGDLSRLRYVLIDDFQDFSRTFYELSKAFRDCNAGVEFFCVGDDWQAINGFAGSDLRFFSRFDEYFANTSECGITTNYRSTRSVVVLGNAVMHGRGIAAAASEEAGEIAVGWLNEFRPAAAEHDRHNGDEVTPALLRVVRSLLDRGLDVVLPRAHRHR